MGGFVYILADFRRGQTYIGVTNDLIRRVFEHREGLVEGYTRRKNIKRLVYFEEHDDIAAAIQRETSLKRVQPLAQEHQPSPSRLTRGCCTSECWDERLRLGILADPRRADLDRSRLV